MATFPSVPDLVERKGSLFLRSNHMNYSRANLNSNWHQAREAEPKDYDINKHPERDLCKATYERIGTYTKPSEDFPETSYQGFCKQLELKPDFTEKEVLKKLVQEESDVPLKRDVGTPDSDSWTVLPRHKPGHNKFHSETTHNAAFKPPYPYTPAEEKPLDFADYSMAYKRNKSQFTDTTDYRREGRNTWQDESGVYTNSHIKPLCPTYKKTDPLRQYEPAEAGVAQR